MRETDPVTWWRAIDTESVSDAGSSITVLVVSLALVALGLALLAVTIWFWRLTRPDPDALGPLVVMSDHDFFQRGPIEQRRSLDAARPGAMVIEAPLDAAVVELADAVDVEQQVDPDDDNGNDVAEDLADNDVSDDLADGELLEFVEVLDVETESQAPDEMVVENSTDEDARRSPIDPLL